MALNRRVPCQIFANLCKFMQIYANLCKQKMCSVTKMTSEIPYLQLALARIDRGAGCDDATETGSRSNGCMIQNIWLEVQRQHDSKYLWNVLMCPVLLHALNLIAVSDWHMQIIESSQLTVLPTHLNLCSINLQMQNLFFRHMISHSPVHARSRANFIKRASQLPKFCTEARDSILEQWN